jgi:hypothetical protein
MIKPLAPKWFMPNEEVARLQALGGMAGGGHGHQGIGRGGLDAKAVLAWAAVGIPMAYGVWITLVSAAALFR